MSSSFEEVQCSGVEANIGTNGDIAGSYSHERFEELCVKSDLSKDVDPANTPLMQDTIVPLKRPKIAINVLYKKFYKYSHDLLKYFF